MEELELNSTCVCFAVISIHKAIRRAVVIIFYSPVHQLRRRLETDREIILKCSIVGQYFSAFEQKDFFRSPPSTSPRWSHLWLELCRQAWRKNRQSAWWEAFIPKLHHLKCAAQEFDIFGKYAYLLSYWVRCLNAKKEAKASTWLA